MKRFRHSKRSHRPAGGLIVTLLLSMLASSELLARSFTQIGETNGLEARVVPGMILDSHGFLWVASREGLFRYDGHEARAFLPRRGDSRTASDLDIRTVFESRDGTIWVGTNTAGLDRYDPHTGRFVNLRHDASDPGSLLDNSIYGLAEDGQGGIWIATQSGLSLLEPADGSLRHYRHDPSDEASLAHNWAMPLLGGRNGDVWIGTRGGGLDRWRPGSSGFMHYDLVALTGGPSRRNEVYAIHEDAKGYLWVGTREGLVRLQPETATAEYIEMGQQDGFLPVITDMAADRNNRLWMTTLVRGLMVLDMDTLDWEEFSPATLGPRGGLPGDGLMSLVLSADQVLIGSWGSGVFRTPIEQQPFRLFNMNNADGMNNNVVSAVLTTEMPGQPWLGSFGGGPQRIDTENSRITAIPMRRHQMREAGVLSLAGPIGGRYYAGTTKGLYEFSGDGIQAALWEHNPGHPGGIGEGFVSALMNARDGGLWVGLGGGGLQYFETRGQVFTTMRHEAGREDSLSGNFVTALAGDRHGNLWVGTRSNGLNRCRVADGYCQRFPSGPDRSINLSHHHVTALYRDRSGLIWVATDGGGLSQVLQDANGAVSGFRTWRESDGLLSDGVMAIEEDRDGVLWLSSRNGLSRLDTKSGDVANLVEASGLPVNHFNMNAASSDEQNLYFGSTNGLLMFPKGTAIPPRHAPVVRITSVHHSRPGMPENPVADITVPMRFAHGEIISIRMAVLDFAEQAHEYAYRMSSDEPWRELGSQRNVLFHGLGPGGYQIQARGRDSHGIWGESDVLSFEIVPPFWMTFWFRAAMFGLLIVLALMIHLSRQAVLRRRASEMLRLGERREQALEEKLGADAELRVLTPRQKEILQLVAEGKSTRDISDLLGISVKTVEAHRANLMERLEIYDVPGLVRLAIRSRLVSVED